jgi:hypothetical protein
MDGLTGTIGVVPIVGWTYVFGGWIPPVVLGVSTDCFFSVLVGGVFTAGYLAPGSFGFGGFDPEMDGLVGLIGAVTITGWTYLLGGVISGVTLGTLEACLFAAAVAAAGVGGSGFGSRAKALFKCPNIWDWCLSQERLAYLGVNWKERRGCRPPSCYRLDWEPTHAIPDQGKEFLKQTAVQLPTPGSGDVKLLEFDVPLGYDGIMYALLQQFAGGGFENASGDLTWRLQINRRWVKNMAQMTTQLGDYSGWLQLDEYIRLNSLQTVSYWVNVAAGAGARLDLAGRVIVGLAGWYYPLQLLR